jgi:hypothetical protein
LIRELLPRSSDESVRLFSNLKSIVWFALQFLEPPWEQLIGLRVIGGDDVFPGNARVGFG